MGTTLLSYEDLVRMGLTRSRWTLSRWIKAGEFPKPVKLGRRVAWQKEEIEEYVRAKVIQRDEPSP